MVWSRVSSLRQRLAAALSVHELDQKTALSTYENSVDDVLISCTRAQSLGLR